MNRPLQAFFSVFLLYWFVRFSRETFAGITKGRFRLVQNLPLSNPDPKGLPDYPYIDRSNGALVFYFFLVVHMAGAVFSVVAAAMFAKGALGY